MEVIPVKRIKEKLEVLGSGGAEETFREKIQDFFYFNDFYIISFILIVFLLVVIFRG